MRRENVARKPRKKGSKITHRGKGLLKTIPEKNGVANTIKSRKGTFLKKKGTWFTRFGGNRGGEDSLQLGGSGWGKQVFIP